jgi:hypothetical protein
VWMMCTRREGVLGKLRQALERFTDVGQASYLCIRSSVFRGGVGGSGARDHFSTVRAWELRFDTQVYVFAIALISFFICSSAIVSFFPMPYTYTIAEAGCSK